MTVIQIPAHTNNYTKGRGGKTPNKVILHWIVGTLASADKTFQNPDRKASAHYGIEDDVVHQYVDEGDTAWHASNWEVNQESVGIEHSGGDLLSDGTRRKPSDKTHETSAMLVRQICDRYNIPIDDKHILPHNKYSATQCPGTLDIPRIIELAKQNPEPPQEDGEMLPKPVITLNILEGLCSRTSENERDAYIARNMNVRDMVVDICEGNDRFKERWVTPAVDEATISMQKDHKVEIETLKKVQTDEIKDLKNAHNTEISQINNDWQTKLTTANTNLENCRATKVENESIGNLVKLIFIKLNPIKKKEVNE